MRIAPFARVVRLGHSMSVESLILVSFFLAHWFPIRTGFTITRICPPNYLHHTRPW